MKKIEIAVLTGLIITILAGNITAFANNCEIIRANVLRLHIMAENDSDEAQRVKLLVRDAVLLESGDIFLTPTKLSEAIAITKENLAKIEELANAVLIKEGSSQKAKAELTEMYFTTRVYDTFIMPAGRYKAIRITIGDGQGKNWWCVMYPPMCLPAVDNISSTEIDDMIYELGSKDGKPKAFEPRFLIVEKLEELKEKLNVVQKSVNNSK